MTRCTDIASMHESTHRAGSSLYALNTGRARNELRGKLTIHHDQKIYIYDRRGSGVKGRDARAFMQQAWRGALDNGARITGRFPHYDIE